MKLPSLFISFISITYRERLVGDIYWLVFPLNWKPIFFVIKPMQIKCVFYFKILSYFLFQYCYLSPCHITNSIPVLIYCTKNLMMFTVQTATKKPSWSTAIIIYIVLNVVFNKCIDCCLSYNCQTIPYIVYFMKNGFKLFF